MVWIILVLACIACWSTTDLFYKKGSDYEDRLSHLMLITVTLEEIFINIAHYAYPNDSGEVSLAIDF